MSNNPYEPQNVPPAIPPVLESQDAPVTGDETGGVIPYKNPKALIAYYLGILSGLPLIGFPIGIVAFYLGIQGLRERAKNPVIKGSVHAWIGIGCGGFFMLFWGFVLIAVFLAVGSAQSRMR